MGNCQTQTKNKTSDSDEKLVQGLKEKVKLLQAQINQIMRIREAENQVYQRELMLFAFKQAEWKRQRKGLKDEVNKLTNKLDCRNTNTYTTTSCIFEQHQLQLQLQLQPRRDDTVDKWKQLYFAIKLELDHLINTTHQEERLCWKRVEEDVLQLQEVKKELVTKDQKIQLLEAKIASMQNQEFKRDREMDILRQSLRIMSHKNKSTKSVKA